MLMERCSPEKMKETTASTAAAAPTATATALGAAALGPFFFLGDGDAVEIDLPLDTAAFGVEFSWCPLT